MDKLEIKCIICKDKFSMDKISINNGYFNMCKECFNSLRTNEIYIAPDLVNEQIYIGSTQSANTSNKMKELGITHIIVVGSELMCKFPDEYIYTHIKINDTYDENILENLDKITENIDSIINNKPDNKILIHCAAGISRSASILIAYLMRYTEMKTYELAYNFLHEKRSIINPNTNFIEQLKVYEKKLNKK
jgi:predicted protein tyrosine phosphatase